MLDFSSGQLFPRFILADKNGYALAKAIEKALHIMCDVIKTGVEIEKNVEKMPEWRLDEMAWELNALWYDYSESLEVKRQQIAGAMTFYDRLGTPYAVLSAVKAVYGDGMLSEWFEYGGDPYHFKVFTTNSTALTENKSKFLALLSAVKSLRSVLDSVTYYGAEGKGEYTIGTKANGAAGAIYAVAEVI